MTASADAVAGPVKLWRAVNMALEDAMSADEKVILLGQDVAKPGGPYGMTRRLVDRFGDERVRDAPISEAALMGCAIGAAMSGQRPIVEIMFFDFMSLALDQLVNQAAKYRWYLGDDAPALPLLVHTLYGGRASMGPQHSQSLEAWLCHVPGLKVAFPSTPQDAYAILRAAIDDPDPVVVVEGIDLLRSTGPVDRAIAAPVGTSRLVRQGDALTVVAWGPTVAVCATALERCGIDADLIDLRWLQPWDEEAVRASVRRTSRLLVVHDATTRGGWGAEIVASVTSGELWWLDAPPLRVGTASSPVPVRRVDWEQVLPSVARVEAAIRELVSA